MGLLVCLGKTSVDVSIIAHLLRKERIKLKELEQKRKKSEKNKTTFIKIEHILSLRGGVPRHSWWRIIMARPIIPQLSDFGNLVELKSGARDALGNYFLQRILSVGEIPLEAAAGYHAAALGFRRDVRQSKPDQVEHPFDIMVAPQQIKYEWVRSLFEGIPDAQLVVLYSPEFFEIAVGERKGRETSGRQIRTEKDNPGIDYVFVSPLFQSIGNPAIIQVGLDQRVLPIGREQLEEIVKYLPRQG